MGVGAATSHHYGYPESRAAPRGLAVALVAMCLVLVGPTPSPGHVILEPEVVQGFLLDISRFRKEAQEGTTEDGRLEAFYQLGEKVHALVDLMNKDVGAHGVSDLLARLIVRRLQEYGLLVSFLEGRNQYVYDFAAFREYLKRSPKGKRAADVRYRLIADAFYRTLSMDTAGMFSGDVKELVAAVAEEEAFLGSYPDDTRVKEVWLFRATDYYRLSKNIPDPVEAKRYQGLAMQAVGEILRQSRGSPEARAAEGLLDRLQRNKEK